MEVGQIIHNNPVGTPTPDYVDALIEGIRDHLQRTYWNTQQKQWEGSRDFDWWTDREREHGLTPLPQGIEWRHYYNWGGSPDDADWDQAQADAPNFSFEGVEIRWYKYFGRSMNANVVWGPVQWVRWYERCVQTIRHWESINCRAFSHHDPIPLPDQNGKVSLEPSADDLRHVELMGKLETAKAQLNCIACVCIDVADGKPPRFERDDWRWCKDLEWVTKLGLHALTAPSQFKIHDDAVNEAQCRSLKE